MSSLLATLREEHRRLLGAFDEARSVGIASRAGREKLFAARALLFEHLEREDRELYPKLRAVAVNNVRLRRLLDSFSEEMKGVAQRAQEFFARYEADPTGTRFGRDLGELLGVIHARIHREEELLYPELERADV